VYDCLENEIYVYVQHTLYIRRYSFACIYVVHHIILLDHLKPYSRILRIWYSVVKQPVYSIKQTKVGKHKKGTEPVVDSGGDPVRFHLLYSSEVFIDFPACKPTYFPTSPRVLIFRTHLKVNSHRTPEIVTA